MGSVPVAVNQNFWIITMTATALPAPRFLRKTTLEDNEYRRNFRQIDNDVIEVITSMEADAVTPLMSKIYLRLLKAPDQYVESSGVLRFEEEIREGKRRKAWQVLCELLRVSSSTANKAIKWLAEVGIIGYFSGKNGVGLRIFLNRASSSIGIKSHSAAKKNLSFSPAPPGETRASFGEAGFRGNYTGENLDLNNTSRTPDGGADHNRSDNKTFGPARLACGDANQDDSLDSIAVDRTSMNHAAMVREILGMLKPQLEATIQSASRQAASREHDRTREWLEKFGLPKVARVAQRESYNILRQSGLAISSTKRIRSQLQVGAGLSTPHRPKPLSPTEIADTAEYCIFRLQTDGHSIDVTLAELSAEAGGYLLAADAPKVREVAEARTQLDQTSKVHNGNRPDEQQCTTYRGG
jgi:hypothetical protein